MGKTKRRRPKSRKRTRRRAGMSPNQDSVNAKIARLETRHKKLRDKYVALDRDFEGLDIQISVINIRLDTVFGALKKLGWNANRKYSS